MFSFNLIISTYYWSQFIFHLFKLLFNHWRRVVTKAAERMSLEGNISDQGGVVWHTQGSGNSLSMLWLATQLMYKVGNPSIVKIESMS